MSEEKTTTEEEVQEKVQKTTQKEAPMNMGFGIDKDTKAGNNIKMLPPLKKEPTKRFPSGWSFPIAKLVNVIAKDKFETKNGETQVLQFIFRDAEGRQHIRTEWAQDPEEEKYMRNMNALNERVNHIYINYYGATPEGGIGKDANGFFEYFTALENAFKVNKDLHKIPVYLKLVYFNGNLDFPYAPNFIETVVKDKPCNLEVNLKYDKVVQTAPASISIPGIGAGQAGGDDDINFDNEYS